MLIDSDVLIWFYRGKQNAQQTILRNIPFSLSAVSYMEILQGIRNKDELNKLKRDLMQWSTNIIQINEAISENAIKLMENYKLSHGLELGDALIAATSLEYNEIVITGNIKHFEYIPKIKTYHSMCSKQLSQVSCPLWFVAVLRCANQPETNIT